MSLVLDPEELAAPGRVELDLLSGSIYAKSEGIDWGDSTLELQKGKARYGEPVLDWMMPNRVVRVPLVLREEAGGDTLVQAIQNLQAKVARLSDEGGVLKRVRDAEDLYADIVGATVKIPDTWYGEHRGFEHEAELVIECLPDFYGEEIVVSLASMTDNNHKVELLEDVRGNYPGRCRIIVKATSPRTSLVGYSFRSKNYKAGSKNRLLLTYSEMKPLGSSTVSTYIANTNIGTEWTPVCSTDQVSDNAPLEHTGAYRVYMKVSAHSPSGNAYEKSLLTRLVWTQGDMASYDQNQPVKVPAATAFGQIPYTIDMGVVRLARPKIGPPKWRGIVQAMDEFGNGVSIRVHQVILVPVDESAGIVIGQVVGQPDINGPAVNDPFNQTSGNLVGKAAVPAGAGNYAALLSGGQDFTINTTERLVQRAGNGANGAARAVGLAGAWDNLEASLQIRYDGYSLLNQNIIQDVAGGLLLRATNANNHWGVFVWANGIVMGPTGIWIVKTVAGTPSFVNIVEIPDFYMISGAKGFTLKVQIVDGFYRVFWSGQEMAAGYDPDIAPGGALGAGGAYIYDAYEGAIDGARRYDNFRVQPLTTAPAAFNGRHLEVGSDGAYREAEAGGSYSEIVPRGDMPRIPVSGRENRPVELQLWRSEGDLADRPDTSFGTLDAELRYRPCWLSVPES